MRSARIGPRLAASAARFATSTRPQARPITPFEDDLLACRSKDTGRERPATPRPSACEIRIRAGPNRSSTHDPRPARGTDVMRRKTEHNAIGPKTPAPVGLREVLAGAPDAVF